jgi:putative DNA primase/helicase
MTNELVIQPDNTRATVLQFKAAEFPTLLNHQDEWLAWDGAAYQPLESATVESRTAEFLQRATGVLLSDCSVCSSL